MSSLRTSSPLKLPPHPSLPPVSVECPSDSQLVPAALETAVAEDAELRRGLPLDYLDYMGVVNSDTVSTPTLLSYSLSPQWKKKIKIRG